MPIYRPSELRRCSVAQSTMRADAIGIVSPSFCHGPCFIERQGPMLVQALDTKPTIERLDERMLRGLSWPAKLGPPILSFRMISATEEPDSACLTHPRQRDMRIAQNPPIHRHQFLTCRWPPAAWTFASGPV